MKDSATGTNGARHPGGRAIHPGSGRRKAPLFPKGRVLRQDEVAAVQALLGDRPRERALLIEYLHLIQDSQGCLPEGYLQALADELSIPMAEIYEVATFYAHFDVVGDSEERPPKVTIRVCDSLSCMLAGAEKLLAEMEAEHLPNVRVVRAPCVGACDVAPAAEVGHHHVGRASAAALKDLALGGHVHAEMPTYQDFAAYTKEGGYGVLAACTSGKRTVEDVIATLSDGGLRGLGGAGFPTGRKWGLVRGEKGPRLMAVNGDEGEPGTFKDRHYLQTRAAQVPGRRADRRLGGRGRRGVHLHPRRVPRGASNPCREIPKLEAAGLSKHTKLTVRRGAGAYICGEESAMIEFDRGQARPAAPPPALRGAGGPVRAADARQQHRDALLGARHPGEGRGRGSPPRARTAPRACAPTRSRVA